MLVTETKLVLQLPQFSITKGRPLPSVLRIPPPWRTTHLGLPWFISKTDWPFRKALIKTPNWSVSSVKNWTNDTTLARNRNNKSETNQAPQPWDPLSTLWMNRMGHRNEKSVGELKATRKPGSQRINLRSTWVVAWSINSFSPMYLCISLWIHSHWIRMLEETCRIHSCILMSRMFHNLRWWSFQRIRKECPKLIGLNQIKEALRRETIKLSRVKAPDWFPPKTISLIRTRAHSTCKSRKTCWGSAVLRIVSKTLSTAIIQVPSRKALSRLLPIWTWWARKSFAARTLFLVSMTLVSIQTWARMTDNSLTLSRWTAVLMSTNIRTATLSNTLAREATKAMASSTWSQLTIQCLSKYLPLLMSYMKVRMTLART